MDALLEHQRRVSVSKIMEAQVWQSSQPQRPAPAWRQRVRMHRFAVGILHHEVDGAGRPGVTRIGVITTRRILYGLAAMVALLVAGTIVGLIWADTSNLAGAIAVVTNIVGAVGVALLLIALALTRRRRHT